LLGGDSRRCVSCEYIERDGPLLRRPDLTHGMFIPLHGFTPFF